MTVPLEVLHQIVGEINICCEGATDSIQCRASKEKPALAKIEAWSECPRCHDQSGHVAICVLCYARLFADVDSYIRHHRQIQCPKCSKLVSDARNFLKRQPLAPS